MKKTILILLLFVTFSALSCRRHSQASLGQFVGTWKATYSLFDSSGARISSGTLTVKQPSSDTVTFGASASMVTGFGDFGVPQMETRSFDVVLKQGSSGNYLLNFKLDKNKVLEDFPLSYSESDGFNGQGSVTLDGKQRAVTASIKKDGQGYIWKISADDASGPKRDYEFDFKEKS